MSKKTRMLSVVPGLYPITRFVYRAWQAIKLRNKPNDQIFSQIYETNAWGDPDSVSGPGSNMHQTRIIREALPKVLKEFGVTSMLDLPCGDFHWMQRVDLSGISYAGADIVPEIVLANQRYASDHLQFVQLDVTRSALPTVDLILVRDCLVHLSNDDIHRALTNIVLSRSKYLLTTTFTARSRNHNIATGQWRMLNLEIAPFDLQPPVKVINECHPDAQFHDKSLALWRIADITSCFSGAQDWSAETADC
jgi:hypothetical protein